MKKLLIILLLISPIHTSQALSLNSLVDWVKPLMPWYEQEPELTFKLTDIKGNVYTEKNTKGKYLVVNFWATWCTPCLKEIPAFVKFYNKNSDHVEILGLDFEPVNIEVINEFIERFNINIQSSFMIIRMTLNTQILVRLLECLQLKYIVLKESYCKHLWEKSLLKI